MKDFCAALKQKEKIEEHQNLEKLVLTNFSTQR